MDQMIIGAIKRQFFYMVTHVFDNSNLSQEMFAIDTRRAVICFLGHGRKHILRSFRLYGDQALRSYDEVHSLKSMDFVHNRDGMFWRWCTFSVTRG